MQGPNFHKPKLKLSKITKDNFEQQTDQTCEKDPFDIINEEYMTRITSSVVNPTISKNICYHCGLDMK